LQEWQAFSRSRNEQKNHKKGIGQGPPQAAGIVAISVNEFATMVFRESEPPSTFDNPLRGSCTSARVVVPAAQKHSTPNRARTQPRRIRPFHRTSDSRPRPPVAVSTPRPSTVPKGWNTEFAQKMLRQWVILLKVRPEQIKRAGGTRRSEQSLDEECLPGVGIEWDEITGAGELCGGESIQSERGTASRRKWTRDLAPKGVELISSRRS
jgi:hypothetical protein